MIKSMTYDPDNSEGFSVENVNRFVNVGVGALLIVFGFIMPKAKRNSLFGLRTKWSMKNDRVWEKSQRLGGTVSVISGVVLIITAVFVPGIKNVWVMLAVLTAAAALPTAASYRFYSKDKE